MHTTKIDDNTYMVELYDWDGRHDEYVAGHVKRDPDSTWEDGRFWRFYPANDLAPICAGDLKRLSDFIRDHNRDIS